MPGPWHSDRSKNRLARSRSGNNGLLTGLSGSRGNVTKKALLWIVLATVCFSAIYFIRIRKDMVDFRVNYKAGERLRNGEDLYPTTDGHFMFKYLPSSALLYVPFSYLPLEGAKAAWYSLTVVCSLLLFYMSYKMVGLGDRRSALWMIWPPLILAKFFFREMKLGQINTIVTALMLVMIWYLMDERKKSSREALPGVFWGLATALKPYALIFFPYFIVKRNWKSLAVGLIVIGAALFAPSAYYGVQGNLQLHRDWASTLSQSTPSLFNSADNVSIIGFLTKWTGDQGLSFWVYLFAVAALAFLVLALIIKGRQIPNAAVLEGSILLVSIPLVSPMGWDYSLLMSVVGVSLLVAHFFDFAKFWRVVLIVNFCIISLTVYDLIGRQLYGTFMMWSVLTMSFLAVLGYLAVLRFRNLA